MGVCDAQAARRSKSGVRRGLWGFGNFGRFCGGLSHRTLLQRQCCERLGLNVLGPPTPYQMRHAGASWEFASKIRTLSEVQRRGRWRSPSSLLRYDGGHGSAELGGRAAAQHGRLFGPMQVWLNENDADLKESGPS